MTPQSSSRATDGAETIERQFELLVTSIKDYAIFMLDPSGRVTTWNAGARQIKGYSSEEVLGKPISVFYTPEDVARGRPEALLKTALSEGRVEDEGWRVRRDGSRFWADVIITALRDSDGQLRGFAKITRDLTRQKENEEKLRRSEESLSATLYSIGDGVLAADEHARITRINPVAERLTGWSEKEAIGRPIEEVFDIVNEETRKKAFNPVSRVLAEGIVVGLANHTALIARDGTERPIADSGAPIRDTRGATRGAVLVFRDVTDERRAEEERLRLAHSEEALRLRDEFLSIASHELKTPLTALQLQLRNVRDRAESIDGVVTQKIDRAMQIGGRLAQLIETLLDVSRIATGRLKLDREPCDLADTVREIVERFHDAATSAGCELSLVVDGPVVGQWDRLRVDQIITNLISNAVKYGSGQPIEVSVAREDRNAVLTVVDKGPGIPEDQLHRIFERFERAASARHYGGMGLGLYVVRQIAEAHGGTITAQNLPGGGAGFTVRLPLVPPTSAQAEPPA